MIYLLFSFVFTGTVILASGYSQEKETSLSEMESSLATLMSQTKNREAVTIRTNQLVETYGVNLLPFLERYMHDDSEHVRYISCAMLWQIGVNNAPLKADRIRIVGILTRSLADSSPLVQPHVAKCLLDFTASDFSRDTKKWLENDFLSYYAKSDSSRDFHNIILICGVADIKSILSLLKNLLEDERQYEKKEHAGSWYGTTSWAARRARARMGSKEDIIRCIQLVEQEKDKMMRYSVLFSRLQYIRQPEVIPVLAKYLNSDEGPLYESDDTILLPARYWAAEALGIMLEDFPARKEVSLFTEQDITLCRKMISAKKEWKIIR
ncbi:MAG: hypothetical protein MUF05_00060 [Candidatus Omnitrophica bacterium]|jgi:hypothetical protein|nr:hypothetical protein [Candidatus Omnitrophota bacterium]